MTSEGIIVGARSGPPMEGIVAAFSIDSAVLKPRHCKWLDLNIIWKIKQAGSTKPGGPAWRIHLYGLASHSGSDAHNLALSQRRAEAVRDYILGAVRGAKIEFAIYPRGEAFASPAYEGALDRAVHIQMWLARPGDKPPPPPPPIEIPPIPEKGDPWLEPGPTQYFRLCVEAFVTFSAGVSGRLKLWINLEEPFRKKHCYYLFEGSSIGISLGAPGDLNQSGH
ncbi:hypothetical protein sos41_21290 [Alphaproteobacteria bacterium SO-S41]|nr:hypothetical protein sos41_21290 [Alphaproteobacteria bacterium SO-S41]